MKPKAYFLDDTSNFGKGGIELIYYDNHVEAIFDKKSKWYVEIDNSSTNERKIFYDVVGVMKLPIKGWKLFAISS